MDEQDRQDIMNFRLFMERTEIYRQTLCAKIEEMKLSLKEITSHLNNLPCAERKGWYQSMGRQVAFIWVVITLIITAYAGMFAIASGERADLKKQQDTMLGKLHHIETEMK